MIEAQHISTLPPSFRSNGAHVLIYFRSPSIWIVCQWVDRDDGYNWLAIGSNGDRWCDDDAELWSPTPEISNADLMRISEQEAE